MIAVGFLVGRIFYVYVSGVLRIYQFRVVGFAEVVV